MLGHGCGNSFALNYYKISNIPIKPLTLTVTEPVAVFVQQLLRTNCKQHQYIWNKKQLSYMVSEPDLYIAQDIF
jgi:hypothetical protein